MKDQMLREFAELIKSELDNPYPYESMSRGVPHGELVDCAMEGDKMVLQIRTEKGLRKLVLQAVEWKR